MLSLDSNLLLYAVNRASPHHSRALAFLRGISARDDVAISEFILSEFYLLLRNPAVLTRPMSAAAAVEVVSSYRRHSNWKLVGFPSGSQALHDRLWDKAAAKGFARRRLFDVRTAITLQAFGVTEFATANLKDYQNLGFERVWNPLLEKGDKISFQN